MYALLLAVLATSMVFYFFFPDWQDDILYGIIVFGLAAPTSYYISTACTDDFRFITIATLCCVLWELWRRVDEGPHERMFVRRVGAFLRGRNLG